jgi:AraC-like DNA-binding protein
MDYLTDWRLGIARTLLKKGLPVKRVAADVGYSSATSFARAFAQRSGTTPKRWLGSN